MKQKLFKILPLTMLVMAFSVAGTAQLNKPREARAQSTASINGVTVEVSGDKLIVKTGEIKVESPMQAQWVITLLVQKEPLGSLKPRKMIAGRPHVVRWRGQSNTWPGGLTAEFPVQSLGINANYRVTGAAEVRGPGSVKAIAEVNSAEVDTKSLFAADTGSPERGQTVKPSERGQIGQLFKGRGGRQGAEGRGASGGQTVKPSGGGAAPAGAGAGGGAVAAKDDKNMEPAYKSERKAKKAKNIIERIKFAAELLRKLGPLGRISINVPAPSDPAEQKKQTEAKTRMETAEKSVHSDINNKHAAPGITKGTAEINSAAETAKKDVETTITASGQAADTQADAGNQNVTKNAEAEGKKGEQRVAAEQQKGEKHVETETTKSEVSIDQAIEAGKTAAELKGLCDAANKSLEAADRKAREGLDAAEKAAKAEAKKQIEAAAQKLKDATTGKVTAEFDKLKKGIKVKLDTEADKIGARVNEAIDTNVEKAVAEVVAGLPPDLKGYAADYQDAVSDKVISSLQGQVDEKISAASEQALKIAETNLDRVHDRIVGPINNKIDDNAKKAIDFANKNIDTGKVFAIKQLDEKKKWAQEKLNTACKKQPKAAPAASGPSVVIALKSRTGGAVAQAIYSVKIEDPGNKLSGTGSVFITSDKGVWSREGNLSGGEVKASIKSHGYKVKVVLDVRGSSAKVESNVADVPQR